MHGGVATEQQPQAVVGAVPEAVADAVGLCDERVGAHRPWRALPNEVTHNEAPC